MIQTNNGFAYSKYRDFKKFSQYKMDDNWQRLGRITSENLKTFLALRDATIKVKNFKNTFFYEYVFSKNSQIHIKKDYLVFKIQDMKKLLVHPIKK